MSIQNLENTFASLAHSYFLSSFSALQESPVLNNLENMRTLHTIIMIIFVLVLVVVGFILNFAGQKYRKAYNFSVVFISMPLLAALTFYLVPYGDTVGGMMIVLALATLALRLLIRKYPRAPNMIIAGWAGAVVSITLGSIASLGLPSQYSQILDRAAPLVVLLGAGINVAFCLLWENVVVLFSTVIVGSLFCTISSAIVATEYSHAVGAYFSFISFGFISQLCLGNHAKKEACMSPIVSPV